MVLRSFFARPNDSLVVTSSSNGSLVGNGVVNNSDTPDNTIFQYLGGGAGTVELDDTGGGSTTFNDDQPGSHVITDGNGLVADGTSVESESIIRVRALDGGGSPTGPTIEIYVFSQNGDFFDVWGFASDLPLVAGTSYIKVSGSNAGSSTYVDYIPCFAEGTMIATKAGEIAVQDIHAGQNIWTSQNGIQPVRWAASVETAAEGAMAPVVFEPGILGASQQLRLSQEHRLWISGQSVELLFGVPSVLVAAKHLCDLPGVQIQADSTIRYIHFMFDRHEIVRANGILTESFFLSETSVRPLEAAPRRELSKLFPCLKTAITNFGAVAATPLNRREATVLTEYLAHNDHPASLQDVSDPGNTHHP